MRVVVGVCSLLATGCEPCECALECGPGTVEVDGVCLPEDAVDTDTDTDDVDAPCDVVVFRSNRGGDNRIYTMNPDGSAVTLIPTTVQAGQPALAPDCERVAYTDFATADIWVGRLDGAGHARAIQAVGTSNGSPAWSPDGTQLAFHSNRDGVLSVYTAGDDGSGITRRTDGVTAASKPDWARDGSRIVFGHGSGIATIAPDGTGLDVLTTGGGSYDASPRFSPDGTRIVFESGREDGGTQIFVMNADGSGITNIGHSVTSDEDPGWSPDGTQVIFRSWRDGNGEIYVMGADGSNPANRTSNPATDVDPDWR